MCCANLKGYSFEILNGTWVCSSCVGALFTLSLPQRWEKEGRNVKYLQLARGYD